MPSAMDFIMGVGRLTIGGATSSSSSPSFDESPRSSVGSSHSNEKNESSCGYSLTSHDRASASLDRSYDHASDNRPISKSSPMADHNGRNFFGKRLFQLCVHRSQHRNENLHRSHRKRRRKFLFILGTSFAALAGGEKAHTLRGSERRLDDGTILETKMFKITDPAVLNDEVASKPTQSKGRNASSAAKNRKSTAESNAHDLDDIDDLDELENIRELQNIRNGGILEKIEENLPSLQAGPPQRNEDEPLLTETGFLKGIQVNKEWLRRKNAGESMEGLEAATRLLKEKEAKEKQQKLDAVLTSRIGVEDGVLSSSLKSEIETDADMESDVSSDARIVVHTIPTRKKDSKYGGSSSRSLAISDSRERYLKEENGNYAMNMKLKEERMEYERAKNQQTDRLKDMFGQYHDLFEYDEQGNILQKHDGRMILDKEAGRRRLLEEKEMREERKRLMKERGELPTEADKTRTTLLDDQISTLDSKIDNDAGLVPEFRTKNIFKKEGRKIDYPARRVISAEDKQRLTENEGGRKVTDATRRKLQERERALEESTKEGRDRKKWLEYYKSKLEKERAALAALTPEQFKQKYDSMSVQEQAKEIHREAMQDWEDYLAGRRGLIEKEQEQLLGIDTKLPPDQRVEYDYVDEYVDAIDGSKIVPTNPDFANAASETGVVTQNVRATAKMKKKRRRKLQTPTITAPIPEFIKPDECSGLDKDNDPDPPTSFCGEWWGISNLTPVEDQWTIQRVEFYWDSFCKTPLQGQPKQQSFSDDTFGGTDTSPNAFDGMDSTMYMSNSESALGGVPAFDGSIFGFKKTSDGKKNTVLYQLLQREPGQLRFLPDGTTPNPEFRRFGNVRLWDPLDTVITTTGAIRCVKIKQSKQTTKQARQIAVVYWNRLKWVKWSEFDALAGGGWQVRPPSSITLWRISNMDPTSSGWTVNELHFFQDRRCDNRIEGIPIGTENERDLPGCITAGTCENTASYMINDNDIVTAYKAKCGAIDPVSGLQTTGCGTRKAYIGYDFFDNPQEVLCLSVYQQAHEGYGQQWHVSQHVENFALESWDGHNWRVTKVLLNQKPNQWNYDYAIKDTLWRLTADEVIRRWVISEVEFYLNPFCDTTDDSGLLQVLPIQRVPMQGADYFDSNAVRTRSTMAEYCSESPVYDIAECPAKAYDGLFHTSWQGVCPPDAACERESNYIGAFFDTPQTVACFKILQNPDPFLSVTTIHISHWNGLPDGGWTIPKPWSTLSDQIEGTQTNLGAGSWNRRPAFENAMWNLINDVDTPQAWQINEVHFFSDTHCTVPLTGYNLISSGSDGVANAVGMLGDGLHHTYWKAPCSQGKCNRKKQFFGIQRTLNRPSVLASDIPHCIILEQHRDVAHQAGTISVQRWTGTMWRSAEGYKNTPADIPYKAHFYGFGGGTGHTRPGFEGTKWRLRASSEIGIWMVLALEFFLDAECNPTNEVIVNGRNTRPIASGFANGFEFSEYLKRMKDNLIQQFGSEGYIDPQSVDAAVVYDIMKAYDKDTTTAWLDIRDKVGDRSSILQPESTYPLWIGVDFANSPTMNCNCLRIWQHPMFSARNLHLEYWDGQSWGKKDYGIGQPWELKEMSGGSWQRWPAGYQTIWRIENAATMEESWEVDEFGLYDSVSCDGTPLLGDIIVSGYRGEYTGDKSLDGVIRTDTRLRQDGGKIRYPNTYWRSSCGPCKVKEAYLGQDFGTRRQVKCLRIVQSPAIRRQSEHISLSYWNGTLFITNDLFNQVGGGSWNRRPAASNQMYRVRFVAKRPEKDRCEKPRPRDYDRPWGVTEIEFFDDDNCKNKVPLKGNGVEVGEVNQIIGNRARNLVASVVAGGYRQLPSQGAVNYDYYPNNVVDGDITTVYASDCLTAGNQGIVNNARCSGRDWIGFDFGLPKVVKCLKIMQSKTDANQCCEAAGEVTLDRWNGTNWVVTTWRHEPEDDGSRPPVIVEGRFQKLGTCLSSDVKRDKVEVRSRRQSEQCAIPLSSVTRTLGHPLCVKHPDCDALNFVGNCCPLGGKSGTDFNSRCCCSFLQRTKIFVDEIPLEERGKNYDKLDLEYVAIRWTLILPIWFMVLTFIWFCLINVQEPPAESKYYVYWERHCLPLQLWFHKEGYLQRFLINFQLSPDELPGKKAMKCAFLLLTFFIIGGSLVWVVGAWIMSIFMLRLFFLAITIVKWSRSPFYPGHEHDEIRRHAITQIAINEDYSDVKYPTILAVVKSCIAALVSTLIFFGRWCLDLLLVQTLFFIIDLGDSSISAYDILNAMPKINIKALDDFIRDLSKWLGNILQVWPWGYMEILFFLFNGIPRCKGPAVLFSSMIFMAIVLVLVKFLNYDFFSLYAAARHVVRTTRPTCQRNLCLGLNFACEMLVFIIAQCSLVALQMFKDLALPVPQNWMCPWSDGVVVFVAMVMLYGLILTTLLMVVLCANGHFYGQDYIIGPLGKKLGINLDRLDPDGTGPTGGMVNVSVLWASIPTVIGYWRDDWNVAAYLMVERAHVYAQEMRTPHKCEHCQEIHVPYDLIVRAQSRNVSLSLQALPLGLLLGKLCEYLNYPPVYYRGKKMKCLLKVKHSRRREYDFYGKMMDLYFPAICSFISLVLFVQLSVTVLVMTEGNIKTTATQSFFVALMFCFLKAAFMELAPQIVLYIEGQQVAIFLKKHPKHKEEDLEKLEREKQKQKLLGIVKHELPDFRVLLGHLAHGIVIGSVYGSFVVTGELVNATAGLWLGIFTGVSGGFFPVLVYYNTEKDTPTFAVYLIKLIYSLLVGVGAFIICKQGGYRFEFCMVVAATTFTCIIFPAVICFRKRYIDSHGVLTPSKLYPVLFTYRGIPSFLSIISSMFATVVPSQYLIVEPLDATANERVIDGITTSGIYRDLQQEKESLGYIVFIMVAGSYMIAIIATYLIAEQLGKRAVIYAIAVAYVLVLLLQPFLFFIFVLGIALVVGILTGSYIEKRDMIRISGVSLHDKIVVYGDLKSAGSKAARVEMQKEQHRQAMAIQNAIDEQRPICLPGEVPSIEEFGDPTDPDYVAPLELPHIPTVAEVVQKKLDEEEDIVKDLKAKQAAAAFSFAQSLREMQEEEEVSANKIESLSSIGQAGSANPNRSLVAAKKALEENKKQKAPLETIQEDAAFGVLLAIEGKAEPPQQGQLALGDISPSSPTDHDTVIDKIPAKSTPDGEDRTKEDGQNASQLQLAIVTEEQPEQDLWFDEQMQQWYDPYSGYFWNEKTEEWYLPQGPSWHSQAQQQGGGFGAQGGSSVAAMMQMGTLSTDGAPPRKVGAISLGGQANHIAQLRASKGGKGGGRGASMMGVGNSARGASSLRGTGR